MKKFISCVLVISLIISVSGLTNVYASYEEYVNNEIFVMYKNGESEVLKCKSKDELRKTIEGFENNNDIYLYQPNFKYNSLGLELNDSLIHNQWALFNDGTFIMEEKKNDFPVFNEPFGEKLLPGQWIMPDFFGIPGGFFFGFSSSLEPQKVTAKEGIDINFKEVLNTYNGGKRDVTVALIDTGIDYNHEDLSGSIWTNNDEIADNGIDDDNNGYIDDYYGWNFYNNSNVIFTGSEDDHGTHGAGTIVARSNNEKGISGVANSQNIKVMSVKALGGRGGSGSTDSIIKAIQYAEKNGALICNLSLGTLAHDEALYLTMKNSNMLFIVAAGNNGRNNDVYLSYPASYDLENMITVSNLSYNGNLDYSSNYGEKSVDISAPGTHILSTTTDNGYSYMTGTSMSAPFVSAACALVYTHFDNITLCNVKEIILNSATKLESLSKTSKTGGMLNIGKALNYNPETLSSDSWEEKENYIYKGNAPTISASIINSQNKTYLHLQFYDADNDIKSALYDDGKLEAVYFNKGEKGNKIELNQNNAVTFTATEGIYTFYAIDSMGNETVETVEIKEQPKYNPPAMQFPDYNFKRPSNPGSIIDNLFNNLFNNFFNNFRW